MDSPSSLFLGCDHAGFDLKNRILELLPKEFSALPVRDCGCFDELSVDYPDVARTVGMAVASHPERRGILICGSGIGMSIAANKIPGVRAAEVWDVTSARLSREHNDANVLCLGARLIGLEVAFDIVRMWLGTDFLAGRHTARVQKLNALDRAGSVEGNSSSAEPSTTSKTK